MIDFRESIVKGLDAHQEHIRSRKEVGEIFETLADQMLSATGGKVGVKLLTLNVEISDMIDLNFMGEGTAIVAFSIEYPDIFRRLSLVKVPTSGFPVILKWSKEKTSCSDAEALVAALSAMLALPSSGRAVADLVEYAPGAGDF